MFCNPFDVWIIFQFCDGVFGTLLVEIRTQVEMEEFFVDIADNIDIDVPNYQAFAHYRNRMWYTT
jgi:hypothetical protein